MSTLQKPYPVAPFIKGARYVLFAAGFVYGTFKCTALKIYDKPYKRQRQEILKKMKEDASQKTKEEFKSLLIMFGEIGGMKFPPKWEPPF